MWLFSHVFIFNSWNTNSRRRYTFSFDMGFLSDFFWKFVFWKTNFIALLFFKPTKVEFFYFKLKDTPHSDQREFTVWNMIILMYYFRLFMVQLFPSICDHKVCILCQSSTSDYIVRVSHLFNSSYKTHGIYSNDLYAICLFFLKVFFAHNFMPINPVYNLYWAIQPSISIWWRSLLWLNDIQQIISFFFLGIVCLLLIPCRLIYILCISR